MYKKLDYIFLDLDGPLLDGKIRHYQCYKDIILKDGGTPLPIGEYWEMKRDKVKRNVVLEKSAYSGTYETFYRQWLDNIEKKDYLELDILKPQINETLRIWKNFSRKIYLVTMRNNRSNLLWQLQKINIYQLLDSVISCDPLQTCTKYEALREIPFSSAIFIGDTEEDTSTAKKLCIKSIAVTNGLRKREHLEADYYVEEICNIQLESIIEQILGSKLK